MLELPAIVRPGDAGDDTAELEAELLVDAFVANQHRSPLSLVEQALACRRLKVDHGLTIKGIAEKLKLKQARVKERLALLELPEALWPRIAAGDIPAGAIGSLLALGKIHRGLPEVAVTLVGVCLAAEQKCSGSVSGSPPPVTTCRSRAHRARAPAAVVAGWGRCGSAR